MARTLTPQDAYALVNAISAQMNGSGSLTATDTSSFISVGETLLAAGKENVLNALSLVIGRTLVAVRPYDAKFRLINSINSGVFSNRIRKISFYSRPAKPAGFENTQLNAGNLKAGHDNNADSTSGSTATPSMFEQVPAVPLEVNFAGSNVYQSGITVYEVQLQKAFRSEADFNAFVSGMMVEVGNDLEMYKESLQRALVLNYIAGVYTMNKSGSVVNLTAAYNSLYSTSYTTAQLQTTYLESFLKFFVETLQTYSDRMTHRSDLYHWAPAKVGYTLLRHTPKEKQKLFIYNPFMIKARATVMPSIFNDQYLSVDNYEGIDYWQSIDTPAAINIKPAIIETDSTDSDYGTQIAAASAVSLSNVMAVLFDEDALMVDYQLDSALSSPIEARKRYYTVWNSISAGYLADYTENCIVFTMEDPST